MHNQRSGKESKSIVPQKRLLVLVSILILLLAITVLVFFPAESASAIGTVIGAFAGVLAVVWFSASLYYQSRQMREQREHFSENFRQLREDSRRNALLLAKDILERAEVKALKCDPALKGPQDLTGYYMNILDWPIILKSTDAQAVLEAGKKWITMRESPAVFLMNGIKTAAELYFRATGTENIDYSVEAELFVAAHGPMLWKLPFFQEYAATAQVLSEMMVRMKPGRASIQVAYWVAVLKAARQQNIADIFNEDNIMDDIRRHKEAGYPIPEIAKDLTEEME